ncbi:hypothetical protein [Xenorhabdus thailandensis]|uniref:hypothetical protein n=1 Tax=Xenorhabdus thailandensis TaxID=3136255 RepID=UPI0030F45BFF
MSNIQSQLNKVLSTVGKLTSSFKSFQQHQKKLVGSVDEIYNQFKKLDKTVEGLKPIVGYAQETARMRADIKAYNQTIKQSLAVQKNSTKVVQVNTASQSANIIQTTQNIRQENSSSKKNKFNLGVSGNITNNFTLLDKLIININPKITILFGTLKKIKAVLKFPSSLVKASFQVLINSIKIFGSVGIRIFGSLRVSLRIFGILSIQIFGALKIRLNLFGKIGIRVFRLLRIGLNIFGQLGVRIFGSLKISLNIFAQLGIRIFGSLRISLSIFGQLGVRVFSYLGSSFNILGSVGGKVFGFLRNSLNTLFSSSNKIGIFIRLRKGIGRLGNIGQQVFSFLGNGINILASVGVKGLSFLSRAFSVLGKAMLFIGRAMMANPILAIIGVIAMAAIYIWQSWETLGPKFTALWENIKNVCSNAWQGIKDRVGAAWEGIKSYFMDGGLIGLIYQNWDTIKQSASETWGSVKAKIGEVWGSVKQNTLEIWESVKKSISDKWSEIVADAQSIPEKLKAAGSAMIDSLLIGIQEKWENLKSKFASITDWFKSWWSGDDKEEITVKTSQEITKSDASQQAKQITQHDKGGFIPAGKLGLVGEYGPEIINGPVNVTSRKNTAKLAALGLGVSLMSLPVAAQDAPLHAQSLPAHAYEEVQAKRERSQPQQYSGVAPQYNIYVYSTQGQSAQDIARVVRQELEQKERMHQARMRSSLSDRGEDFS